MHARVLAESLMHYQECLLFLVINIKRLCLTNSFISRQFNHGPLIWIFSSIRSYRKINKLNERSLRLCHNDYTSSNDELSSKQDLANFHITNIQQLMIEIFQMSKRYISLVIP